MNVLILGSGGREHALAWKISQSPLLSKLYIAPGNPGTSDCGTNLLIDPEDFRSLERAVVEKKIGILLVGPEAPLVAGIHDFFLSKPELGNVKVIGPDKRGAMLEGSKDFAKEFMFKYNIPTARYKSFTKDTLEEGKRFLETFQPPYVLKADGLAAGKGVLILDNIMDARTELENMLGGKFGKASSKVIIEEFLSGIELSVFILTDGKDYLILPEAKDYKRVGEADTGLNTGGMGAVSPVPFADKSFMQKVEKKIVIPTVEGLKAQGIHYCGFIFVGLMKVKDEPFVIEYNVRMGDPEAEVVIPRIKSDFLEMLIAASNTELSRYHINTDPRTVCTVMLVSGGYPGSYEKGKIISGINDVKNSIVFHAGTKKENGNLLTSGGRVISVSSYGINLKDALEKSYTSLKNIIFSGMYYRKDIGFDL